MSILHSNEKYVRKMCSDIGKSLGIPSEVVRTIVECQNRYLLADIAEAGREARDIGMENSKFRIELPLVGTLTMHPKKYPDTANSYLNGRALRSEFKAKDSFLYNARGAYYANKDFFSPYIEENFNKFITDKYTRIIMENTDNELVREGDPRINE